MTETPIAAPRTCARCGASLPSGASECPRCLLGLGLRGEPSAPGPAEAADAPLPAAGEPPTLDEVRAAFPELEVQELLGRGAMGAVFKARQPKLERGIALKVLARGLGADPKFAERFLREARALARLAHPSIVAVHDFGARDGIYFLVLEYVDGLDLRRLMKQGRLEPSRSLAIARELCDALQYAHDEGVVHRDIKPENVLIDAKGRVRVADFGLAKLVGERADAMLTRSDQVMGTPHYMAPEQLERPRDVDHRADIFALGVMLYEMLTGSLPRGNFEPPSHRVQVHVKLDEIVLKALEREPERRYQHALEVKSDVEHVPVAGTASATQTRPGAARDAAPASKHFLRGWRVLPLFAALWIALAATWNAGPFAYGIAIVAFASILVLVARARQLADPELAAIAAEERSFKRVARSQGAFVVFVLALLAITIGHYSLWARNTHAWVPAAPGPMGGFEQWKGNAWELMRLAGADHAGVEPVVALGSSFTVGGSEAMVLFGPWMWMAAGFALLCLGFTQVVRKPAATISMLVTFGTTKAQRRWHVSGELASWTFGALVLLWLVAPVAALRDGPVLQSLEQRFDTALDHEEASEKLNLALLESDLGIDVEQELSVRDQRSGDELVRAKLLRAQSRSPFRRWSTSFAGPLRHTPQLWATVVQTADGPGSTVILRAGLYDPGSTEFRDVGERLDSITREIAVR